MQGLQKRVSMCILSTTLKIICFLSKHALPLKNIRECSKTQLTDTSCQFSNVSSQFTQSEEKKFIHVKDFLKEGKRKTLRIHGFFFFTKHITIYDICKLAQMYKYIHLLYFFSVVQHKVTSSGSKIMNFLLFPDKVRWTSLNNFESQSFTMTSTLFQQLK